MLSAFVCCHETCSAKHFVPCFTHLTVCPFAATTFYLLWLLLAKTIYLSDGQTFYSIPRCLYCLIFSFQLVIAFF